MDILVRQGFRLANERMRDVVFCETVKDSTGEVSLLVKYWRFVNIDDHLNVEEMHHSLMLRIQK